MKKIIIILLLLAGILLSGNFSDNPEENYICPKCEESNCIYNQIEDNIEGDGTDSEILQAAKKVFLLRGIKDSSTIKNILSNYSL